MYRMLFVDINMPGIGGIELVKILKGLQEKGELASL
jgi:YesN/AraC family two-component response regulator